MLSPERVLRLTIELIFILLGVLLVWLGRVGRISGPSLYRRSTLWLILSVVLILWGLRVLYKPGQWWARWENGTRGLSLALLGIFMLVISRVPFIWVGPMLAAGGVVLAMRGVIGSVVIFRPR